MLKIDKLAKFNAWVSAFKMDMILVIKTWWLILSQSERFIVEWSSLIGINQDFFKTPTAAETI